VAAAVQESAHICIILSLKGPSHEIFRPIFCCRLYILGPRFVRLNNFKCKLEFARKIAFEQILRTLEQLYFALGNLLSLRVKDTIQYNKLSSLAAFFKTFNI